MKPLAFGLIAAAFSIHSAMAEDIRPVKPLAGYKCMKLIQSDAEAFASRSPVSIMSEPINGQTLVGAPSVLLVKTPEQLMSGYLAVKTNTGRDGWIEADRVSPYDPNARCVPSLMSNGHYGGG